MPLLADRAPWRLTGFLLLGLFTLGALARVSPRPTSWGATSCVATPWSVADEQYRAKRFDHAAVTLRAAAASDLFDDETSEELLLRAGLYTELGELFEAAASDRTVVDRYRALRVAIVLDQWVGGAHHDELRLSLRAAALHAAIVYTTRRQDGDAAEAVHVAESIYPSESTRMVRRVLAER